VSVSVQDAGWEYLDFSVHELQKGEKLKVAHPGREVALLPLEGELEAEAGGKGFKLARKDVFSDPPYVLYVPPTEVLRVSAVSGTAFAVGGAPAEGRYPVRLIEPEEMRTEMRGGGPATRQIGHVLAAPLPAERLILYEVISPLGGWCGWPPHCHDGFDGSPYLEETYYFRFDRADGFALQRNYRTDEDFDELFVAEDGDLVLVTKGYHTTTASPGANMYFLNYLAGELTDQERARPPCFDSRFTWITSDWDVARLSLPTGAVAPMGR
jgi:5-deoxy-glucuronate isomerase